MRLIGVDGCRAGWISAASDLPAGAGRSLEAPTFRLWPSFQLLLDSLVGERALIAIDIPVGLPGGVAGVPPDNGRRRADAEARRLLGAPRAASVFSAPCRLTLAARTYPDACATEVRARGSGKGLSRQAFGILPKIREVDEAVSPDHQAPVDDTVRVWVREVHPEVTFALLSPDGRGLAHPKRGCTACRKNRRLCDDADARLTLLRQHVSSFDPDAARHHVLEAFREQPRSTELPRFTGVPVGRDDVIDAVACLVTAGRIARGEAVTLPNGDPQSDARGLRMEIVA